jgi:hypothetical protein
MIRFECVGLIAVCLSAAVGCSRDPAESPVEPSKVLRKQVVQELALCGRLDEGPAAVAELENMPGDEESKAGAFSGALGTSTSMDKVPLADVLSITRKTASYRLPKDRSERMAHTASILRKVWPDTKVEEACRLGSLATARSGDWAKELPWMEFPLADLRAAGYSPSGALDFIAEHLENGDSKDEIRDAAFSRKKATKK